MLNLLGGLDRTFKRFVAEDEKRAAMALIAELELRYNIAVEARRAFLKP